MEPLVSVNCLTYNHAAYIKNALDGFLLQKTNFPFEVCIHDDASTDGTQDIIRGYEKEYPHIFKVIYQKENQTRKGVRISKKYQYPRMRGKYAALCEGDDYWFYPHKLQIQTDYLEAHDECVCAWHPVVWVKEQKVTATDQVWLNTVNFGPEWLIANGDSHIATCSEVLRMDIAKEWTKFRAVADIGDYPLTCLLATYGHFHYTPVLMGAYRRQHQGSWTYRYQHDNAFAAKHSLTAIKWLYEFNLYSKGKYAKVVGQKICAHIFNLKEKGASADYERFLDILVHRMDKSQDIEGLKAKLNAMDIDFWSNFLIRLGKSLD